jgi:hypothetical protein
MDFAQEGVLWFTDALSGAYWTSSANAGAAMGGGKVVIGLNVQVAAAGAILDVPLGHKDDS